MFDSPTVSSPLLAVYGPWLIGGIAGLVTFFVTAAIMGIVLRRRDRIRLERSRGPLPGTIQPIQTMPLEPMRSPPFRQAPHIGWLILLAVALIGAVMVVLWTPQAKGDGIHRHSLEDAWRE
jgi:H+/Cl- antiporter ClcA